jgi:sugar lactone lactonase YvrE
MIRGPGSTLYVADHDGGRVASYHLDSGAFLGNLDTGGFDRPFFPRGIVRGPDDLLYVSVTNLLNGDGFTGYVVRFNAKTGRFVDIFTSNVAGGCAAHLHRPEGLVFGPDHKLYVTSFRADAADADKILVFDRKTGKCLDKIDLSQVGEERAFAQALMFGPQKRLFVPISSTGEVRRYNVESKTFDVFVRRPGGNLGGPLLAPFYLSFGQTDPGTLEYDDD